MTDNHSFRPPQMYLEYLDTDKMRSKADKSIWNIWMRKKWEAKLKILNEMWMLHFQLKLYHSALCGALFTVPGQWVSLWDQDTWPPTTQGQWKVPDKLFFQIFGRNKLFFQFFGGWEALPRILHSSRLRRRDCLPCPVDRLSNTLWFSHLTRNQ